MIFHIPHSSTVVPTECRDSIVLSDADLQKQLLLMTDHYTDDLFGAHADRDDTVVKAQVSRLVVDVERFEDDYQEEMAKRGMGVIYTCGSDLAILRAMPSINDRNALLSKYYRPHHNALTQAVEAELDRESYLAFVLDCHSFPSVALPYENDQNPERPDFCLGTDAFHTPYGLEDLVAYFLKSRGYSVAVNSPFSGALVPAKYYKEDESVASLMIEINRKLYMKEVSGDKNAGYLKIKNTIGELIEYIRLYIEEEGDLSAIVKQCGSCIAFQDWDSGGPGAGAGRVELYALHGRYYCFNDEGYSEYDSLPDAFSESDALRQTSATKKIGIEDELIEQCLTDFDIARYKRGLRGRVEEWLGADIPDEGSEDYENWMLKIQDIDAVTGFADIRYWIECHSSGDFIDFLACH